MLFAAVMKTARFPKAPIRDKKPPPMTLFIFLAPSSIAFF
jgi:hypothetical protein